MKGDVIPSVNTRDGSDASPFLAWHFPPGNAQSFVLIMDDLDAQHDIMTHWIVFDIPADVRELPFNDHTIGVAGCNDFQLVGYHGPCPPLNEGRHRYAFRLFALDVDSLRLASRS